MSNYFELNLNIFLSQPQDMWDLKNKGNHCDMYDKLLPNTDKTCLYLCLEFFMENLFHLA
ncbi:CLUMA_CG001602, isoform A [Clunio marinus]|uniref:CLUMA_CG001602, isoform A n=1 Tax=Clunio marinus TaxID=568069 RepID=A0A1J1HK72_9DIPT|nr:CLUMA_CG001602, isoform A [Clunio marinus]